MFKYSFDFKFKAVKYVVYGKHSYREAARKFIIFFLLFMKPSSVSNFHALWQIYIETRGDELK